MVDLALLVVLDVPRYPWAEITNPEWFPISVYCSTNSKGNALTAPRVPILSLIAAEPTALGVDLISGGKRELLPGGVVGPVASEVSSMVRNWKATGKQK